MGKKKNKNIKRLPTIRLLRHRKDGIDDHNQRYHTNPAKEYAKGNFRSGSYISKEKIGKENLKYNGSLDSLTEEEKYLLRKFGEAVLSQSSPVVGEIIMGYKIASNVYYVWEDLNTIFQKKDKTTTVKNIANVGLSLYHIETMYDLIKKEKPYAEKILKDVFLDLTRGEISLVLRSI